jgi:branched-subunit amino acid permease
MVKIRLWLNKPVPAHGKTRLIVLAFGEISFLVLNITITLAILLTAIGLIAINN